MEARRGSTGIKSDGIRAAVAGTDPDCLLDRQHANLAVADPPGPCGALDRLDDAVDLVVLDHHLDFPLGDEVDDLFGTAIELGMALLATEALDLTDSDSADAGVVQRVLHIVQLERLDDRFDLFHGLTHKLAATLPQLIAKRGPP